MKFCALVSGGKDSCMNLLYCQKEGHELVACANLRPRAGRPEEIDSFMFQTVGSNCLDNLAKCLDVPLYVRDLDEQSETHEIDDIVKVLQQVMVDFPDIKGVSVGAIASGYQQTKVDIACQRLGLVALCYLWQRDQSELLHDIVTSGLEARMIKVAGYGLNDTHLGKTLAELEPTLISLHEKNGLYPCGEGGEYETMVFDSPQFKQKMHLLNPKVIEHSTGDVYYLSFDTSIERKDSPACCELTLETPPLLEDCSEWLPTIQMRKSSSGLAQPLPPKNILTKFSGSFASVFEQLDNHFSAVDKTSTVHVCVLLQDMAQFQPFNKRYNELFDFAGPPSRKCIAATIKDEVTMTVFGGDKDWESKGIHVQGLSYWAPANIGPYSQSRLSFGVNYMAGQIGLAASSLELVTDAQQQCQLALQNAMRIARTVHGDGNWTVLTAVVYIVDPATRSVVQELWPFSIPLVIAQVKTLPRNAVAEWDLTTVDLRYIAGHPPDDDDLDEDYYYKPEHYMVDGGFVCHYGNQRASVLANTDGMFVLGDQGVPVQSLFFGGEPVNSVSITI